MKLIVVESPAKCKTIQKYVDELGDYVVLASGGHIRQIAKNGVDEDNNFKTKYTTIKSKSKYINNIRESASNADEVIIATDADREGHAIGWHIAKVLKLNIKRTKRIIFHEITKKAIGEALSKPGVIDMNQVYSQQGRSILDRLIGFKFSPLLWKHIKDKLSAGRVQSVATRMIVDKENEIKEFEPKINYKITGEFSSNINSSSEITAKLSKTMKKKSAVEKFLNKCLKKDTTFVVNDITKNSTTKNPPPPFITSTLQASAGKTYGMSPKAVMSIAQKLYEKGKITYHRTDSTALSQYIINGIKMYVIEKYGEKYYQIRFYKSSSTNNPKNNGKSKGKKKKGDGAKAQEAHEAIRPTNINCYSLSNEKFTPQEIKLYSLIWKRTVASQMKAQEIDVYNLLIHISCYKPDKYYFIAKKEKTTFMGYTIIYNSDNNDYDSNKTGNDKLSDENDNLFGNIKTGNELFYTEIKAKQNISSPPGRYKEHSLVSDMKKKGIGRPSTYAYITSVIQDRNYVVKKSTDGVKKEIEVLHISRIDGDNIIENKEQITYNKEKNKLFPTSVGIQVTQFLLEHFPNQMDYDYTNNVENKLDDISIGKIEWTKVVGDEYNDFMPIVKKLNGVKKDINKNMFFVGKHPETDEDINAYVGKYGPVLRIGNTEKDEDTENKKNKYRFVSLDKNTVITNLTIKKITRLIRYPLNLGEYNDKEIIIKNGPYGKYMVYDSKNYSLSKYDNVNETLDFGIKVVSGELDKELGYSNTILKRFENDDKIIIRSGRYGPYICKMPSKKGKKPINARIPKNMLDKIDEITLQQCLNLIDKHYSNPSTFNFKKRGKGGYKKKK